MRRPPGHSIPFAFNSTVPMTEFTFYHPNPNPHSHPAAVSSSADPPKDANSCRGEWVHDHRVLFLSKKQKIIIFFKVEVDIGTSMIFIPPLRRSPRFHLAPRRNSRHGGTSNTFFSCHRVLAQKLFFFYLLYLLPSHPIVRPTLTLAADPLCTLFL